MSGQNTGSEQGAKTVLLVEDDPDHLHLILRSFADAPGAPELWIAGNLGEAIAILDQHTPDLVIADLQLPDGEGTELLDRGEQDSPAVIILTARGDEETAVRLMKAGAFDYLVKSPQTFAGLPHTVERSLRDLANKLARERLQLQLNRAQRLETLGSLASGIAHDFNNILTAIIGYASLVEAKLPSGDPLLADMAEISKAGRYGAELTTQLLAFSSHQLLSPQPCSLNQVILDFLEILQRLLTAKIRVRRELAEDLDLVFADPGQIRQVLLNLAVNARDAMPHGGIVSIESRNVEVAAGEEDILPSGRYVLLSVRDSGEGMSPEVIERVFEPFFTTKAVGTGLGLATVYGIVNQSGGHIEVRSEPGLGSVFDVYLPILAEVPVESAVDHAKSSPVGGQVS